MAGADEIKQHPWFANIHWALIRNQKPPYVPSRSAAAQSTVVGGGGGGQKAASLPNGGKVGTAGASASASGDGDGEVRTSAPATTTAHVPGF